MFHPHNAPLEEPMEKETDEERALRDAMRTLAKTRHALTGFVEAAAQIKLPAELAELPPGERARAIELFTKKAKYLDRATTSMIQTTARNMGLPALLRYAPEDPDPPNT